MYLMMPPKAYLRSPEENPTLNYFPHSWALLIWNNWNADDKIEQGGIVMFPFIFSSLPAFVFLIIFPSLFKHLSKNDHYRFNSLYGFRSTKAVKNASNWQYSQLQYARSSYLFGSIQLALSILLKGFFSFSDDSFLLLNTLIFFSLLLVQFFYVNSKLDSSQ